MKKELSKEQEAEVKRRLANPGESVPEAEVQAIFNHFKSFECEACPPAKGGTFEGNIPNAETVKAIKEYEQEKSDGTLTKYASIGEMMKDLKSPSDK